MRRSLAILLTGGLLLLASLSLAGGVSATTKVGPTTTCSNGSPNTPGLGLICQVTVVNRITTHGGTATIVVRECHGAAGAPTASCKVTTWHLSRLVTKVTQCNNGLNGGGATVRCSVRVTNDFVGMNTGATAATVNQCVGSGSITVGCDPFPATTTGATITQCNGSAGGGTLVQLKCTASGTKPSAHGSRSTSATARRTVEARWSSARRASGTYASARRPGVAPARHRPARLPTRRQHHSGTPDPASLRSSRRDSSLWRSSS